LMRKVAAKHSIKGKALNDLFVKKFERAPDEWNKDKLEEDGEDEDWRDDPMKWHGDRSDSDWYDLGGAGPLKVKFRPRRDKVTLTVRNFEKISPTEAEVTFTYEGLDHRAQIDLDNPTYHFKFYSGSMHISARRAFNLFQTNLHHKRTKTPKPRAPIKWEPVNEDGSELDLQNEVDKFVDWSVKRLHIKNKTAVELSMNTKEAQDNHHTGGHVDGDDSIWVYVKNRNLVDILRTVFHELVHVRQGELKMIRPVSSYTGSTIEAMADMLAGKWIKR